MNRKPLLFSVAVGLSCALLIIFSILLQPASQKSAAQPLDDISPQVQTAVEAKSVVTANAEKPADSVPATADIILKQEPAFASGPPPVSRRRLTGLLPQSSERTIVKAPPPPDRVLVEPQARPWSMSPADAPPARTGGSAPNEPAAPPLPSGTPLVASLDLDQVWGLVGAGSTVTVAVDGAQAGAAVADGIGFFWTPLYDDWGDQIDLDGGETLNIYENGILVAATTLRTIAANIDPLADDVTGVIGGASFPGHVTVYAGLSGTPTVSQTTTTDSSGNFTIDFSGTWDFFADEQGTVAYWENGIEVYAGADAHRLAVLPFPTGAVTAKAAPNAPVTVTVYLSDATTVRDRIVDTTAEDGRFWLEPSMRKTDIVVADIEGWGVMTRTVDQFTPQNVDAANDRITGQVAPGATVRGRARNLTANGYRQMSQSTVADATGVYTLDFGGIADIMPGDWAGIYVADAEGDDMVLWAPAQGYVRVHQTNNDVWGRAVAPPGHMANGHLITLTFTSASDGMTYVFSKGAEDWGSYYFSEADDGLPDIIPGDVITVESDGYGWQGVVDVMTITAAADTANERFTGTVEPPSSRVEIWGAQWDGWSDLVLYPTGGTFNTLTTASSPFSAGVEGFDVRNAVEYEISHRTAEGNVDRIYQMVDFVRVWPQYNGVLGSLNPANTPFTLTLRDRSGGFKAQLTGTSGDDGWIGWNDFNGEGVQIETGDEIQVESAAGFDQTVVIPDLLAQMDEANDRVTGYGPPNALLNVNIGDQGSGFVPTDDNGEFAIVPDQLQDFQGNGDLEWGQSVRVCYQTEGANHVCQNFDWPQIIANYGMDGYSEVWGYGAAPGSTLLITITESGGALVDAGSTPAGSGDQGPSSYRLEFPYNTIEPGQTVWVNFGDGLVESVDVVEITAFPDVATDIVTGTAPANSQLSLNVDCRNGGCWSEINGVPVDSSGIYTADFATDGDPPHDIDYGDEFNVHHAAYHNHQTQYSFNIPVPDIWIEKQTTSGVAVPGSTYLYRIRYGNNENGVAENVTIVDTLPASTTYASNSASFPVDDGGSVVTFTLGDVPPYSDLDFYVTLNVDGSTPAQTNLDDNCAVITTTSQGDLWPWNEDSCTGGVWVDSADHGVWVDKQPSPNDPVPGQAFAYEIDYGTDGSGANGPVWLTDTLPADTTFVGWQEFNGWSNLWTEVVTTGGQFVLYAPAGIPGDIGGRIRLTLLLDAAVSLGTRLENTVVITTGGDAIPDNNSDFDNEAKASGARYDMRVEKYADPGNQTPGGTLDFSINYENQGNIATHAWLTDTLPEGTSYQPGSAGYWAPGGPVAMEPVTITGDSIVWDLGSVPVNEYMDFWFSADIDAGVAPGTTTTNCITIGGRFVDVAPENNTACATGTIFPAGANLAVSKAHEWYDNYGRLQYSIDAMNIGNTTINNVLVTDTLPSDAAFSGNWWTEGGFPANINFTDNSGTTGQLIWELERMEPGWSARLYIEMQPDDPGEPLHWYTNTVEITEPTGDPSPADNTDTDVAFSGGEVDWVNLDVYRTRIWGCAPQGPVTVTTASETRSVSDCFDEEIGTGFMPGDTVTVTAGAGTHPVIIDVPAPFTGQISSITDTVWGQIDALDHEQVRVNLWDLYERHGETDGSGHYSITYTGIPHGAEGDVSYQTEIDYADVGFYHRLVNLDLTLQVNYGHDWVEGNYEAGHTVWITVTDSGGSIEATAEMTTGVIPWWNDRTGFSSSLGDPWSPEQPDIEAGDWVYATMDNGYTNSVHLGDISGVVDTAGDSVSGTVNAAWIGQVVDVECHPWDAPGGADNKRDSVFPDGADTYACAWDPNTEWDVQPGQEIGVSYDELDGDRVYNVFHDPAPYLRIQKDTDGTPAEGGNFQMRIRYRNEGDLAATGVVISDTFLYGLTYVTDTSGLPHTGTGTSGDPLLWDVGTLDPGDWIQFTVFAEVTATAGEQVGNSAGITTSTPYDQGDPGEKYAEIWSDVQPNDTHLNVGKNAWTDDPLPDSDFVWAVNVCNNGSTSSSAVVVTDTLPVSITLVNWWGQHPGWTEVLDDGTNLVVSYPALPDGWCSEVYLTLHVDPAAQPGTQLWNNAVISATNDLESDDNETWNDVWVGEPHTNLEIKKHWNSGMLVPGGELRYQVEYNNNGNVAINDTIYITDTLPVSTTFRNAWHHDQNGSTPVTPALTTPAYVVWEIAGLPNGYSNDFEVTLDVDNAAAPGTILTNTIEISPQADEDSYEDNTSHWTETLNDHGPNLRIRKDGQWNDWGENTRQARWNVTAENIGDETVMPVVITDTYPAGMYLDGGVGLGFWRWWDWRDDPANHTFTVTLESLDPGESVNFGFNTITDTEPLPFGLIFTNTVEIGDTPDDVDITDNDDDAVLTTGPDLYVTKDWVSGDFLPGELVTFSLTFGNDRHNNEWWWNLTGDAWLTDTLPAEMAYVTSTLQWCMDGDWCGFTPAIDGNDLTWQLWPLGSGDWNEIHLTVRITDTVDGLDAFTNRVDIASDQPLSDTEAIYSNNVDSYEVAIDLPYFEVSKRHQSTTIAGALVTYTLTVTNTGYGVGTGVILSDTIPAGLENATGGTITLPWVWWSIDSLAAQGGTAQATFSARIPCSGVVTNDEYRVSSSDQGVTSDNGEMVSFLVMAPTLVAGFDQSTASTVVSTTLYFTDTSTTDGPAIAAWAWDFGDGDSASGATASHAYATDDTFTVTLTITDTCGYTATTTSTIEVALDMQYIFLPLVMRNN